MIGIRRKNQNPGLTPMRFEHKLLKVVAVTATVCAIGLVVYASIVLEAAVLEIPAPYIASAALLFSAAISLQGARSIRRQRRRPHNHYTKYTPSAPRGYAAPLMKGRYALECQPKEVQ